MREDLLARSYKTYSLNYLVAAAESTTAVESATTAVESATTAAVSTVEAAESVVASVEAPPQAANAAIAKIANTFFILVCFKVWYQKYVGEDKV